MGGAVIFFTTGHAARAAGLSESRIRQLVDAERIPAVRATDGSRLILSSDLQKFIAGRVQPRQANLLSSAAV